MSNIAEWVAVISFLGMAGPMACFSLIGLWNMALDYAREEGGIMGILILAMAVSLTTFLFSIAFLGATR